MRERVTDYFFYRWRYIVGYSLLIATIATVLLVAFFFVPGELRQGEMDAAVKSVSLSYQYMTPAMVVDLPYHVLQRMTIDLLGFSTLTIKLPSLILGMLTAVGFFFLVKLWFRSNVAIFATLLAATSTQFIFMSQDGTPTIMYTFLAVWLLLAGTMVTRQKIFGTLWKVLVCVFTATLLYSPLGVYLVIAILTTMIFHPHIRYVVRRLQPTKVGIAIVLGLAAITPLLYASAIDSNVGLIILGIPTTDILLKQNIMTVIQDIFGFSVESSSYYLRPFYSLGAFLLIAVGTYKLLTQNYTARSYIIFAWGLLLLPFIVMIPSHVHALYVIFSLLIALGIATLIADWYKLFPRNPYARVVGLLPLTIVVVGIMVSGVMRYMNNYQYNGTVLRNYSKDLVLLKNELRSHANATKIKLIVAEGERPFYAAAAKYDTRFTVTTNDLNKDGTVIITRAVHPSVTRTTDPYRIITNSRAEDADRFYVYK
jgi:uncharacterized membrane protein